MAVSASSKENALVGENDVNKAANELITNEIKEDVGKSEPQMNAQKKPAAEVDENKARTMSPEEIEKLHALMKSMKLDMNENEHKLKKKSKAKNKKAYLRNHEEEDIAERPLEMPDIEEIAPTNDRNPNLIEALSQIVTEVGPIINKKCYKAFMEGSERGPRVFGNVATTLDSRIMKTMLLFFRAPISLTAGGVAYVSCLLENASARSFAAAVKLANRARGGLKFVNRVIDTFLVNDRDLAIEMAREEARD